MKRTFGSRINTWLYESPGQVFRQGKWRFWFPTLIGLTSKAKLSILDDAMRMERTAFRER